MSTENTREACPHCEWFKQTFGGINDLSPREYWIAIEIWTKLHGGRDYCYEGNGAITLLARFDAEKKRAFERIKAEIRPLLDLRDAKIEEMDRNG